MVHNSYSWRLPGYAFTCPHRNPNAKLLYTRATPNLSGEAISRCHSHVTEANPFLLRFMKMKVLTALVGRALEKALGIGISTNLFSETIWQLAQSCQMVLNARGDERKTRPAAEDEQNILLMIILFNRCTLIEYPVAFHIDRFAKMTLEEFISLFAIASVVQVLATSVEEKLLQRWDDIVQGTATDMVVVAIPSLLENKALFEIV
jgi:hypothetical protein